MSLNNKNVLVAGGAGFIGSHLCEALVIKKPHKLIVVDNLFLGKESNLESVRQICPRFKFYKDSVSDYRRIKELISKNNIDVVFNLAVVPLPASLVKPKMTFKENVSIVLNLCELARKKYFKTLIHCSSSEVYGSAQYVPMDEKHPYIPSTPYAASKLAGDQLCLSYAEVYGIEVVIVRPFNNYGQRQNDGSYAGIIPIVIKKTLQGKTIEIYGDGNQTRDYIFVKDTVFAFIDIYESKSTRNKVINIASGKEISINKLVKLILDIMENKNIKIKHVAPRPGDVRRHCADIKLARKLIDFEPRVNLKEGLLKTVEWYLKRRHEKWLLK